MMEETFPQTPRQRWMAILARASGADLAQFYQQIDGNMPVSCTTLREAEVGLTQVRARVGGTGNPFNVGEMTLTRCVVQSAAGHTGHAYVAGRDKTHALFAAKFDALLQDERYQADLLAQVIEPLASRQAQRRAEKAQVAETTKVDFFTLVRGEDE